MKYDEAMDYIHKVGNFGSNYGLERTYRLLEILGNPQEGLKLIHIAGTNGKGSTTSIITSLLMEKGFKVGMYTSPFLEEFEERIQINRNNIPKDALGRLMDVLKVSVDQVILEGYNHPTEFEIITCLMLLYFKEENIDYGVIEVGLGGRLDSTNVITPILSIITSISLDHTNLLGNTLEEIAGEKAGIIKKAIPVISYPQEEEAKVVIERVCKENNSSLYIVDKSKGHFVSVVNKDKIYQKVEVEFKNKKIELDFALLGEHQITNLLVALKGISVLEEIENIKFTLEDIKEGVKNVQWKGRLEVMKNNPLVVIDGAHNIQGIKTLNENVHKYFTYKNIYLLLGILADKQVEDMVKVITPEAKKVYALTPHSNRAELSKDLKKVIDKYNSNCIALDSYEEGLDLALSEANEEDLILISGSLYMIGDMRGIIRRKFNK